MSTAGNDQRSRYRGDIDGLRAIAVVAVILFHLDVPPFTGGFVGVDVFFVISGYLITCLILSEQERGSFSFLSFYGRRIRRIVPALTVVSAVTTVLAVLLFMPSELKEFGESLASMALFSSNFYFWNEVDYFDTPANFKPLLHTWSVAVEEQYYIIYPLLLWSALKFGETKSLPIIIGIIAVVSFYFSVYQTQSAPPAAFYLLPSRAWELLIGAFIALVPAALPHRMWSEVLALLGMCLIAYAVFFYDQSTAFPGAAALLPCLGTAALIVAGGNNSGLLVRVVGSTPLVWVGLISYSLYLWHWPLIVMAKYVTMRELTPGETLIVLVAAFALSALTWRFVEQPWRVGRLKLAIRPLAVTAASVTLLLMGIGVVILGTGGLPHRVNASVNAILDEKAYLHSYRHCHNREPELLERFEVCTIGAVGTSPTFLIWGDSHADMYVPAIAKAASEIGRAGVVFTRGGCAPALGTRPARGSDEKCARMQAAALRYLSSNAGIRDILLAGYWRRAATGSSYDATGNFRVDDQSREASEEETRAVFRRGLARLIDSVPKRNVYLIADIPEIGFDPPNLLARRLFMGLDADLNNLAVSWQAYAKTQAHANEVLHELADRPSVTYVNVDDILCRVSDLGNGNRLCAITAAGRLLYRNGDHLSTDGALLLTDRFKALLSEPLSLP